MEIKYWEKGSNNNCQNPLIQTDFPKPQAAWAEASLLMRLTHTKQMRSKKVVEYLISNETADCVHSILRCKGSKWKVNIGKDRRRRVGESLYDCSAQRFSRKLIKTVLSYRCATLWASFTQFKHVSDESFPTEKFTGILLHE